MPESIPWFDLIQSERIDALSYPLNEAVEHFVQRGREMYSETCECLGHHCLSNAFWYVTYECILKQVDKRNRYSSNLPFCIRDALHFTIARYAEIMPDHRWERKFHSEKTIQRDIEIRAEIIDTLRNACIAFESKQGKDNNHDHL